MLSRRNKEEPRAQESALTPVFEKTKTIKNDFPSDNNNNNGPQTGILSNKPPLFFQALRDKIDNRAWSQERCESLGKRQFGIPTNRQNKHNHNSNVTRPPRRLFFGTLVADEPWELYDIIATETKSIFAGIVFVESNRSQALVPRPWQHNDTSVAQLQDMFGTKQLVVQKYVNEDQQVHGLTREHHQRHEIIRGWKALGMTPNDVGILADLDESFTRDFYRAVQLCPYLHVLDYDRHKCHKSGAMVKGLGPVFEASPQCFAKSRVFSPSIVLGGCLEGMGDPTKHVVAQREDWKRAVGYGTGGAQVIPGHPDYETHYAHVPHDHYPLYSTSDIRMQPSADNIYKASFHLHNWFAEFPKLRNKYKTYGHPIRDAMTKPLHEIHDDIKLMTYCLRNWTDAPTDAQKKKAGSRDHRNATPITERQDFQRVLGGFQEALVKPLYFYDEEYIERKHQAVLANLKADDEMMRSLLTTEQIEKEAAREAVREAKRQVWLYERENRPAEASMAKKKVVALEKQVRAIVKRYTQSSAKPKK